MNWQPPPDRPQLPPDGAHVWRLQLDAPQAACLQESLSAAERAQAARFTFPAGRRRFTVARVGLRRILGRYLAMSPASLTLATGPHGKPFLCDGSRPHDLRFNLSHTGDLAVIALAWGRDLGIDIEDTRRRAEMESLARRFFSPAEAAAVLAAPGERRRDVFFRVWTTKEAYLKALGVGLSLPLDQFDTVADLRQPPGLLATRHDPGNAARWAFTDVPLPSSHFCTLAVEKPLSSLALFHSPPWDG